MNCTLNSTLKVHLVLQYPTALDKFRYMTQSNPMTTEAIAAKLYSLNLFSHDS